MGERYAFTAEWLDPMAQIVWKFQLLFYTQDNTIEMYDIKNRRTFLKRSPATNLSLGQIYVGATITLHARQLHIVEYADDFTKRTLSMTRQKCAPGPSSSLIATSGSLEAWAVAAPCLMVEAILLSLTCSKGTSVSLTLTRLPTSDIV